ncbi:MAG: NAD(P)-dependent oxidoreductase [Candidatus Lokiarchaeota archaeon]|nr:NAD(P)-dependent oxidoreductase [Candidatus Lokiarchaeota archaeon]
MIIIDKYLAEREAKGNPIRVGMIGAGFMGRGIALQLIRYTAGIDLVVISNRHISAAERAYNETGISELRAPKTVADLEQAISHQQYSIVEDPYILCEAGNIDAIIEVTGAVEFSANVVFHAIQNKKHVIMMNAELDGTIGPILKSYADANGVVITNSDGDQPGVLMNLYRFVKGIGIKPVLCGNIKGLHDPYRNPTTQRGFAEKWKQKPEMVTSFADGTKISFEQAIVANATGMKVGRRGMFGPEVESGTPIQETINYFPQELLLNSSGIVDYVVGADPSPGVFLLGTHDHPIQKHYLNLYKLGEGPMYCFYRPYHLCHFETGNSIARAVLFNDATLTPSGEPKVDVVATAKVELHAGEIIDGLGGYMTYGLCENIPVSRNDNLIPIGLAQDCRLIRDVPKDQVLTFDDVELPEGRLSYKLWREQNRFFNMEHKDKRKNAKKITNSKLAKI